MIKKDLKAPQLKYIISKMNFFVGTRMHANFAAIYTGVPLFGLAYSYKFQGAFEANGVFNSTAIINNINELEADTIVKNIIDKYNNLA
jgi:colanic acid/amylovoran biosynthesis protein